jgi:2-amino-4-hydroxy-6-hydroxymethyldihydropteridine diphosphokinase
MERALAELARHGLHLVARSSFYRTPPLGTGCQPPYMNAVFVLQGGIAPAALLRLAKRLERTAGRRRGRRWGPRPLDIDILDLGGCRIGRPGARRMEGRLVLPHPELARRAFVLIPLAEVLPQWRHPALGVRAADLLRRSPGLARGIERIA